MVIGYLKHRETPTEYDMELCKMKEVSAIYKETSENRKEYRKILATIKEGDTLVLSELSDLGDVRCLLSVLKKMAKRGAYVRSVKEPWVDTGESTPETAVLEELTKIFR